MQENLLQLMALGSIALFVFVLLYVVLEIFKIKNPFKKIVQNNSLQLIYITSFGASVGSILLSLYFLIQPCELCWYQRAFLFSIPVISLIALIKKDTSAKVYIFYISIIGALIALYHSLLQAGLFKEESFFCDTASSDCVTPAFVYFGFVTIPVISLSVFLFLILLSYESKNIQK